MRALLILALLALSPLHCSGALAHSHKQKGLEIVHPWCFATNASVKATAVNMLIRNRTKRPDRLIGATSTSAQKIEIRQPTSSIDGGRPRSRPSEGKAEGYRRLTGGGDRTKPEDQPSAK
jgi:copper(I)-binding protein